MAISPDNKFIVSGSWDNSVRIWEKESGKEIQVLKGHSSKVSSVAISPDSTFIVSGGWDRSVRIWEKESGKEI